MSEYSHHGAPALKERRGLLSISGRWFTFLAALAITYPLLRFVRFKLPRMAQKVRVEKDVPINGFHIHRDFILFVSEKGPWAVSRKCTHLGCSVAYNEIEKQLVCPCHQSRFSIRGQRLAGPAQRDLAIFPVEKAAGGSKGYTVTV